MLEPEELRLLVEDMWQLNQSERVWLDRIYGYVTGTLGVPQVPEGAPEEVKDLARLSVKNVLGLVRDSFVQNLSVIGYRTALAQENGPAWDIWQAQRMDARQAEVYRPAVTYGCGFVTVTKGDDGKTVWRCKSPRQLLATYEDPQLDLWPQYAFEQWIDQGDAKAHWRGLLYDDEWVYPLDMGKIPTLPRDQYDSAIIRATTAGMVLEREPYRHGADVCPVVRFVDGRDPDDMIIGEIAPLIRAQQAINAVNFDRMIVSRWGAFPQKVITGWSASPTTVLEASARRVWAFDDNDVQISAFPPADLGQYNGVLEEMTEALALAAQISPSQITGKLVNVSAEALAAAEANQQRKLAAIRDSFGESWEQVFRLASRIEGDASSAGDTSSEVVWRDTEARSFGAIVDGITKLAAAGIPIEELVDMIPSLTQQKVESIKSAVRMKQVDSLVAALNAPAAPAANGAGGGRPIPASSPPPARPSPANMPAAVRPGARNGTVTS